MLYIIVSFVVATFLIILITLHTKRQEQKRLDKLRNAWGRIKDEYFNFELIESYSKINKELFFHQLSTQTINDIDFYDLFCFTDRTTSMVGQQFLFDKLKKPTNDINSLKQLDEQASYFSKDEDSRERVQKQLILLHNQDTYYISALLQTKLFTRPKWLNLLIIDSLMVVLFIILLPFYPASIVWLMLLLAVNMFLHLKNKNNTFQFIKSFPQLNLLITIASKLCKQNIPFEKSKAAESIINLKEFQKKFRFLSFGQTGGDELSQAFWLFLELVKALFLIELHTFYSIIKVLENKQQDILCLFKFVGAIDTCISIASLRAGAAQTCQPEFTGIAKEIDAKEVYHPLIPGCVTNSISIRLKSVLITGSNMSGKTTFLRTIAVNAILAQTIYTCFATAYKAPALKLFSSVRIDDDLLEGKSYYLAEVDTMATLIKEASSPYQSLFLLDEVFKGTNTVERIASAKAILSYLNKANNIVIVSTHDLELSELLSKEYDLYHFEETILDDRLTFDHLLKKGPLKTRNAIKILELSNYPLEIIEEATNISMTLPVAKT